MDLLNELSNRSNGAIVLKLIFGFSKKYQNLKNSNHLQGSAAWIFAFQLAKQGGDGSRPSTNQKEVLEMWKRLETKELARDVESWASDGVNESWSFWKRDNNKSCLHVFTTSKSTSRDPSPKMRLSWPTGMGVQLIPWRDKNSTQPHPNATFLNPPPPASAPLPHWHHRPWVISACGQEES